MTRPGQTVSAVCAALLFVSGSLGYAAEGPGPGYVYPLDTCVVAGGKLGEMGEPVVFEYEGRELRLCCAGCRPAFDKEPEKYLKRVDAAIVAQQKPYYPLDTCVVAGGKLGEMGEPVDHVYQNRLVRLCCADCVAAFDKEPAKYLTKLDQAVIARQKAAYPLDTCLVMGTPLGPKSLDFVSGNRLLRMCCNDCIKAFAEEPAKYLAKLDQAATEKAGKN